MKEGSKYRARSKSIFRTIKEIQDEIDLVFKRMEETIKKVKILQENRDKNKEISEDEARKAEDDIQKITDAHIKEIETKLGEKENALLEI